MSRVEFLGILIVIACLIKCGQGSYQVPTPTLELLSPKGFRISIPHEPGITLVAFHGRLNGELKGLEPGRFSGEGRTPVNGRWVYENTKELLMPGDVLYYWIYVQHGNTGYVDLDKSITVPRNGGSSIPTMSTNNGSNGNTIPTPGPSLPTDNVANGNSMRNCVPSKTIVRGRTVCAGDLIFEDNFDTLNWTKWRREIRIPLDTADADFVAFHNRPENCYITSGHLNIVPNLLTEVPGFNEERIRMGVLDLGSECTGIVNVEECRRQAGIFRILPPIVSARIRTKEFFSFQYGKVEVRARLTKGDWLFPQIFLEPYTNEYGITGYSSGQMRVAFIRGNEILDSNDGYAIDGTLLSGGVVLTTGNALRDVWLKSSSRGAHLGRSFHTYTLTWTDDAISLAIDGNNYATIGGGFSQLSKTHNLTFATKWESGGFMAPFDKEFYISLGVSAGGYSDFPDGCRNGPERQPKPWINGHPKQELKFWNDRDNWHKTWDGANAGMEIDYIKVWAL